jgi:cyclopropane fatty-acyl-phospholipid synthase-like methyltransferase
MSRPRKDSSGAADLDLGCGHGVPISQALVDEGATLYAIDASPSMVAAFRSRFPGVPAECKTVDASTFFGRTFDGVVAWGLMFLLEPKAQERLIHKVAARVETDFRSDHAMQRVGTGSLEEVD